MRPLNLGRMLTRRRDPATPATRRSTRRTPSFAELEGRAMPSVTIAIDYTYDASRFFDTQAKKDVLQLAANTVASALNDTLLAIVPSGSNTWTAQFPNPSNPSTTQSIPNLIVPADTVIIYVGAGRLSGTSEAGEGSTGGFNAFGDNNWLNNVLSARGKSGALLTPPTAFGPWGGSIAFDGSGGTNWFFGTSTAGLNASQTDFLSVAEHEIGHVLGLGTADSWTNLVSGGVFHGPNATAANGGTPVPVDAAGDHWADGVRSDGAPAAMTPVLTNGTRSVFTTLDYAGLKDIGWQVAVSPAVVQFGSSVFTALETAGSVTVTVTRSGGLGPFSIAYATSDGTGRVGTDYRSASGTLNFASSDTSKIITISVLNNQATTATKTVNLALSSPSGGATLGTPAASVLNIVDPNGPRALADFDSDGRSDIGVYRPSTSQWIVVQSTAGLLSPIPSFGAPNLADIPIVGDFEGIGRSEIGVFRPSTSQWFVLGPTGGKLLATFGAPNLFDIPVPGDYDGDGKVEPAVYRPSTSQWFVLGPTGGRLLATFGAPNLTDIPVPGDWDGVGRAIPAVFRPSTSQWFALGAAGGRLVATFGAPNLFDIPVPGTYDNGGRTQPAVFRPSTSQWFALGASGGQALTTFGATNYFDIPIEAPVGSLVRLGLTTSGGRPSPGIRAFSTSRLTTASSSASRPSVSSELEVIAPWVAPAGEAPGPLGGQSAGSSARRKNAAWWSSL